MPDWSYQTILRPLLFRLPPETARDVTLTTIGRLAEMPLGPHVIDIMGHMRPPESARVSVLGLDFPGRVGLGAGLDTDARACRALARFGFGFLEVGPVTTNPVPASGKVERDEAGLAIRYPDAPGNSGVDALRKRLEDCRQLGLPVGVRLAHDSTLPDDVERLAPYASFFTIAAPMQPGSDWEINLAALRDAAGDKPILISIDPHQDDEAVKRIAAMALACGIRGVIVGGECERGAPIYEASLAKVRLLHREFGDDLTIIGSGGIIEPRHALAFLDAGAALVQIHSGLVYSGPGLPKRINEAVAFQAVAYRTAAPMHDAVQPRSVFGRVPAWVWAGTLGLGLAITGVIVWIVAMTRVVLPYDEAFVNLSRAELTEINQRLLPFMAHDRVTAAGTLLSTGILYVGLALGGIRYGQHWAKRAYSVSAAFGFLSFFLFIGYGYFDPLHAVLTIGLLPLFLASVWARRVPPRFNAPPNLTNDPDWRLAQWGQLFFVAIGVGLILAGFGIMSVGVTSVFVPADLRFMDTTSDVLSAANPRLLPLVAHDRAGFGGNLVAVGLGVLLMSLWGFREGHRWVWWTLMLSGAAGFVGAIGVHLSVGYVDLGHLFPAILAVGLYAVGLALSFTYLHRRSTT